MKAFTTGFVLASSLLSFAACGSVSDPTEPTPDPGDTTAPTIVQATPAIGDIGVPAEASIVITFSEPMDRGTVEAAYASSSLPLDKVSLAWNEAGDMLTIRPDHALELVEGIGNDPSAYAAKQYALALAATSTDLAGNPLAAPFQLTFTTQKRMSTTADSVADLTRYRVSNGGVSAVGADLRIGDNSTLSYRGFVTFDLTVLPPYAEIESAIINVRQTAVIGAPFTMGGVETHHITYDTVNSVAWAAPSLETMGALTTTADLGARSLDVTTAVGEDYAERIARSYRSQYRLQFPALTTGDGTQDNVELGTATFEMSLVYLAP